MRIIMRREKGERGEEGESILLEVSHEKVRGFTSFGEFNRPFVLSERERCSFDISSLTLSSHVIRGWRI